MPDIRRNFMTTQAWRLFARAVSVMLSFKQEYIPVSDFRSNKLDLQIHKLYRVVDKLVLINLTTIAWLTHEFQHCYPLHTFPQGAWCTPPWLLVEDQGAATMCYLALNPKVKGVTGKYFSDSNLTKPSTIAKDQDLAEELWDLAQLSGSLTEEIYFDFHEQPFIYSHKKGTFYKLPYPTKETFAFYLSGTGYDTDAQVQIAADKWGRNVLYEVRPSENDLIEHTDLIREAVVILPQRMLLWTMWVTPLLGTMDLQNQHCVDENTMYTSSLGGHSATTNADMHHAGNATVSSSGGWTSNAGIT
ncbi:hypothetical protein Tco_1186699, partial [Tanacetum coccineum]